MDTYTNIKTEEKWIPCYGYEGIYEINIETDEVKSVDRIITDINGKRTRLFKGKKKKTHLRPNDGYLDFTAWKDGKGKAYLIHIAKWEAINGKVPDGCEIHHKNHIKTDNTIENLVCLTKSEHFEAHKKDRTKACVEKRSKPVLQYTKEGQFVAEYPSAAEASRQTGIPIQNINDVCNGKIKTNERGYSHICRTAGGSIWKYK